MALVITAFTSSLLMAQQRAKDGAVLGGVAGAIIGGIAGHQNDETPEGIAIGGAVGAIAGGLLGNAQEKQMIRDYEHQQYHYQQRQVAISRAVSLNDVVALTQSGLSPNLIVSQIRKQGVTQRIGVPEIIMLHQNGVSEAVIQEMQNAHLAGTTTVVRQTPVTVIEQRPAVIVDPNPRVIIHGGYSTRGPRHGHYPHRAGGNYHRYHR